jgi:hypothetical protein
MKIPKFTPSYFTQSKEEKKEYTPPPTPARTDAPCDHNKEKITPWKGMEDLITFFDNRVIPSDDIRLNECTIISDPEKFVQSYIEIVKANDGKETYKPYFDRLNKLRIILLSN